MTDLHAANTDSPLVAKVRKLLAMAEGSPNPNEADAFSRKAAELIAAHRIDPERLRRAVHDELRRARRCRSDAAPTCAVAWRCCRRSATRTDAAPSSRSTPAARSPRRRLPQRPRHGRAAVQLAPHPGGASRMATERRATPAATQQWRRSFMFGYAQQIRSMLNATADEAVAARPSVERRAAGAASPRQARRRVLAPAVRARRRRPPAQAATVTGWEAGKRAASRADLGRARLPEIRAIGSGR